MKSGLYSNILVKKAHKGIQRRLLSKLIIPRKSGYSADIKDVKVQVNNLQVDNITSLNIILVI